ncbi:hypothetical protein LguiB_027397 [Lonicera macranthoides]
MGTPTGNAFESRSQGHLDFLVQKALCINSKDHFGPNYDVATPIHCEALFHILPMHSSNSVTVFKKHANRLAALNERLKWLIVIKVGDFCYVKEGLLLGHLHGNRFTMMLRGVVADSEDIIKSSAEAIGRHGFISYFGLQKTSVKTEELLVASLTEMLRIITSSVLGRINYKLGLRQEGRRSLAWEDQAESRLRREVERGHLLLSRSWQRRLSLRRSYSRQRTSAFASLRDNMQIFMRSRGSLRRPLRRRLV